MTKPVRVMQIIDGVNFGGAEVLLRDLTHGLLTRGYKVSVLYNSPGPIAKEIENLGVTTKQLQYLWRVDPFLLWKMWKEIRRERPEIVHTHLFKSDFNGRLAARLAGVPVVVSTIHNSHNWARNPILGRFYGLNARFADKIITVSDEVREYALRYEYLQSEKVITIPNAIPTKRFMNVKSQGEAIRKEFDISMDATVIGIVARLVEQKDHETFLRAASKIARNSPNTFFMVVGDGVLREALVEQTVSLGIEKVVLFTGARKDIPAIYGALDMLVFSSLWEGLPVALLEGMAAGLPIVATKVGGVPGVLDDQKTGLLVPPSSPDALAEACLKLIVAPNLRQQMGTAARAYVNTNYSMDTMVDAIADIYDLMLKKIRPKK